MHITPCVIEIRNNNWNYPFFLKVPPSALSMVSLLAFATEKKNYYLHFREIHYWLNNTKVMDEGVTPPYYNTKTLYVSIVPFERSVNKQSNFKRPYQVVAISAHL